MRAMIFSIFALALIAGCGDTEQPLHTFQAAGGGPDEFAVIPVLPLTIPTSNTLPAPTPGGTNLTDPSPNADAIAALGGNAAAQVAGGVPTGDAAIVAQASRYGVDQTIRADLATADAARIKRGRRTNVLNPLNRDRYFATYARQALDAYAELKRLRALGVTVPDAPEK